MRTGGADTFEIRWSGRCGHSAQGTASAILGDARHLPFPDCSFDAAVSTSSLHHWGDPRATLAEILRVLRPGGRLILTDWADDHLPTRLLSRALRLVDRSHRRSYSVAQAARLLTDAGFRVVERERYRSGWKWGLMTLSAERPPPR